MQKQTEHGLNLAPPSCVAEDNHLSEPKLREIISSSSTTEENTYLAEFLSTVWQSKHLINDNSDNKGQRSCSLTFTGL